MSFQVNILRGIIITIISLVCILLLPIFIPVGVGLSALFTDGLKIPAPPDVFILIISLLFIGIGSLTAFKYVGWIPFTILVQELYFIGIVYGHNVLVPNTILFGLSIALLCIIFVECSSRLSAINSMQEVIPVYQEESDKLNNYIKKVQTTFPNVAENLDAGKKKYRHSPSVEYIVISIFAITLSTFAFYLISQIGGRRYQYIIVGILLPIVAFALSLQKVKKEEESAEKQTPRIIREVREEFPKRVSG